MSAHIIPLPGAALAPVVQHPRRGRFPRAVTPLRVARNNRRALREAEASKPAPAPAHEEPVVAVKSLQALYEAARFQMLCLEAMLAKSNIDVRSL